MFETLQSSTSNLVPEVEGNTLDISILQAEVADLQEQVANLGASTSEVSVYELMTNDGSKQSAWNATLGTAFSSLIYEISITGDIGEYIFENDYLSFYNPTTSSWFYGQVSEVSFSGGSTIVTISFNNTSTYSVGASWQDSSIDFPVYKGDSTTGEYNFTNALNLENDAYWKFEDVNYKYWSKIKASFVVNEPYYEGTVQPILINNSTANKSITLRDLPCGSFVDLELSFEKQWNGTAYDTVTLVDVKYNTSTNIALSEDSELLFGGYKGFNPTFSYGVDLYDGSYEFTLSMDENIISTSSVQDVVNSQGVENTNRKISRYAKGPSYPNNSADNFFTGATIETIVFNSTNMNITLLNIEQSFGKMPVSVA
jgi:hypothetical protein